MAKRNNNKPVNKSLVDLRNDIILSLREEGYGPTAIAFVMNRTKQLISHIVVSEKSRK